MSIIAISGKKTVGKDTTGQIIQYLTSESNVYPFDLKLDYSYRSNWQIKKFADKLKDIICLLIGCSREQLEDESFKNTELGEEWWYWYMERDGGYSPIILDYLTTTKKQLKNYEGLELVKPTPRFLMQYVGTDLLRNQLHPEIWVTSLMSEYKPIGGYYSSNLRIGARFYDENGNLQKEIIGKEIPNTEIDKRVYPNFIITDTRFENELEAVKKRGGITIRVNRPCDICGGSGYHKMSCPVSKSGEHYSEIAIDKSEFDYIINNDSDIQSLIEKVREILKKEKLI